MTQEVMLSPKVVRSYMIAHCELLGWSGFVTALINLASHEQQVINGIQLNQMFRKIIWATDNWLDIDVPKAYLVAISNEFAQLLGPKSPAFSERIGQTWWGKSSPLVNPYWRHNKLYYQIAPHVIKTCSSYFTNVEYLEEEQKPKISKGIQMSLNILAEYFIEHFYCDIEISKYSQDKFLFHVKHNTLAENDDERFRVFYGLLQAFCEWLTVWDTEPIMIDKDKSSHNRIIITFKP